MSAPIGSINLDFLDGYLFRVMVDILKTHGPQAGLYNYYEARVHGHRALSDYDRMIFGYALKHFDRQTRRVVHAGIGIGTLASALAIAGFRVAGIEHDVARFGAATQVHNALVQAWPEVADRYRLKSGGFPAVVEDTPWIAPEAVLVFTNCGAGWSEELTTQIIESLPRFGDVIFDARLFGVARDLPAERQELLDRIEAQGLVIRPITESPPGAFYHHLQPKNGTR